MVEPLTEAEVERWVSNSTALRRLREVARDHARLVERAKAADDLILAEMRRAEAAEAQLAKLAEAIRDVHSQHADDLCWMPADVNKIFVAAGLPPQDLSVGDTAAMLRNCERYVGCLQSGGPWKPYAELEAQLAAAQAERLDLERRSLNAMAVLDSHDYASRLNQLEAVREALHGSLQEPTTIERENLMLCDKLAAAQAQCAAMRAALVLIRDEPYMVGSTSHMYRLQRHAREVLERTPDAGSALLERLARYKAALESFARETGTPYSRIAREALEASDA